MKKYIWQNSEYPKFTYDKGLAFELLTKIKFKQGVLIGKMSALGFQNSNSAKLNVLTEDIIKSSEIEGLNLNSVQVRSSVAKRLGFDIEKDIYIERNIEGVVEMMLDATQNYSEKITNKRLLGWQASMFPGGFNGLYKVDIGKYRNDKIGPMQVVSGAIGHEKVHYQAPPASNLKQEMSDFINYINNETETDFIIKAGIVHLWFVIIHPFEDGNGRIARALTDMMLARSENSSNRYYSMSSEIKKHRKDYYKILEMTQKDSVDITLWLKWFLETLLLAIENSEILIKNVIEKSDFWKKHENLILNERQQKILNKLFDNFEGKLTTSKWAKLCNCSQDTATRDISDLLKKNVLIKQGDGRATNYVLASL